MNIHTIIEECEIGDSAFVFYVWMKSKFCKGAKIEDLIEYGVSIRSVRRYLSELTKADLIESQLTGNRSERIYRAV